MEASQVKGDGWIEFCWMLLGVDWLVSEVAEDQRDISLFCN